MATRTMSLERILTIAERVLLRYGLAVILLWIGAMKFTAYEAHGIAGFEANSFLFKPLLAALGEQGLSNILGVTEIMTGLLLIAGRFSPRLGLVGSAIAIVTFAITLTFIISTPGWEPSLGGFPALSAGVGQFLLKDLCLAGAAVYTARESLVELQTGHGM
ncbi:MAG: DUF417 family protein [Acidobacteriaceae bacterium]|nr:DUF417 family protein [Acidobacteriaceae bacterium]